MFSFIKPFLGLNIKLLVIRFGQITVVNLPVIIKDYTDALQGFTGLLFTFATGTITVLHAWKKYRRNE